MDLRRFCASASSCSGSFLGERPLTPTLVAGAWTWGLGAGKSGAAAKKPKDPRRP
jgi:hypothetical protein